MYEQDSAGNYTKKGIFANLINQTVFKKIVNSPEAGSEHKAEFVNDSEGV